MTARRPAAVVLDYGEVISTAQDVAARCDVERLHGISGDGAQQALWRAYRAHRDAYDSGALTAAEYWARVASLARTRWDPATLDELVAADVEGWLRAEPRMLAWIGALHEAGVRLALLSNAPVEIAARLREQPWAAAFDLLVFSCDLGVTKPDPAIYRHCLGLLGLTAPEVLFVDDRADNVDAARALGVDAVRFTGVDDLAPGAAARGLPLP